MEILDTTEEERLEATKKWWKENGLACIFGIVLGLVVIYGWNYYKSYQLSRAEQASDMYDQLLTAIKSDKNDSVDKIAQTLQEQYANTDYAIYSRLFQADLKVQKNDLAGAKAILEKVVAINKKEISNIAKIRMVRIMLANKEYQQGLQLISEIDPVTSSSFSGSYDELIGDLYVGLDRLGEARTSYQKALDSGYNSPLLQLKIDDLTAPERMESKK
jgi:predicted negative regulator of RcsB-dependent stress response